MKKDVIYIDTEDDITSIIERVKRANAEIVALVPPKRVGMLQSVVNLKLLKKAAESAQKRVVLISNDSALASLAGGVKIPTAKNLQSRPEIAHITALEIDNSDVINGEDMPIGEVNDALGGPTTPKPISHPVTDTPLKKAVPLKKSGGPLKVPDFLKFRKKLFIIAGGVLAFVVLMWWAFWLAPSLTVTITAKTTIANVNRTITLDPAATQSDAEQSTIKPLIEQLKKTNAVDFDATGKKDVGDKATGTLTLTNDSDSAPISVAAGTIFTAVSGQRFTSTQAVSVPGARLSGGQIIPGTTQVAISAADIGAEYNVGPQAFSNAAGVKAGSSQATAGGSRRTVTVVSDADVEKAKQQLGSQNNDTAKAELLKQFEDNYRIIDESFRADAGQPAVSPAIGQEATKAKLTVETTYTLTSILKRDLDDSLNLAVREQITNQEKEHVYDNGKDELKFKNYSVIEGGKASVILNTTGYIGTKINEQALKEQMVGKRYGDIEAIVNQNPNIEKVQINFSPFWVTNGPAVDKITINFNVVKQ